MKDLNLPDDLKRCIEFHGHLCPGVVIGYCAAKLALRELAAGRADDEELIAIVENDTCAVDAIQVLTGCTFGKGNLCFRDYGKMVFTFATRGSGRSVRLLLRDVNPPDIGNVPEDRRRLRQIEHMLERDPGDLFDMRRNALAALPDPARILESATCDVCGERVMTTRLLRRDGQRLCIPCAEREREERRVG